MTRRLTALLASLAVGFGGTAVLPAASMAKHHRHYVKYKTFKKHQEVQALREVPLAERPGR